MNFKVLLTALVVGPLLLAFSACTAKVYVMDRHTLMEDEAAGSWPDFEKDLLTKAKAQGPTAFQKVPESSKEKRLYNVLNGEPTSKTATK